MESDFCPTSRPNDRQWQNPSAINPAFQAMVDPTIWAEPKSTYPHPRTARASHGVRSWPETQPVTVARIPLNHGMGSITSIPPKKFRTSKVLLKRNKEQSMFY
ncbi:hypothetical protein ACLOJK_006492 [Asimina triloba]